MTHGASEDAGFVDLPPVGFSPLKATNEHSDGHRADEEKNAEGRPQRGHVPWPEAARRDRRLLWKKETSTVNNRGHVARAAVKNEKPPATWESPVAYPY